VTRLELSNYRRFESLVCDFEPDLTVLVAENGGGKTALLDTVDMDLEDLSSMSESYRGSGYETAIFDVLGVS
jgi:predicted ATP-binding protein involved in virulence